MTHNFRAAGIMLAAMVMLSLNDAVIKHAGATLTVPQMLLFRGLLVMAVFVVALKLSGLPIISRQLVERWTLARGAFEVAATTCFLSGLVLLPLAVASSLGFSSPIFIALLAGPVLGERVGALRWMAMAVGFGGTLLITRPFSADFSAAMLLPVAAAALVAGRDLVTRRIGAHQSSLYVALITATMVTVGGAVMSLFSWRPVTAASLAWIALAAVLLSIAYFSLITAFRTGEAAAIAPLKYVSIVIAIILGALIWDERLTSLQFAGVAMVVAAGVIIFYRERRGSQAPPES